MRWLAGLVAATIALAPSPGLAAPAPAATPSGRDPTTGAEMRAVIPLDAPRMDPSAEAAYKEAQGLLQAGDASEAVARLDLAIELEPSWAAPVRLRAQAFATLAERYKPSSTFLHARAADLERLLVLEPGVETAARRDEIAALQIEAREARLVEQRRRNLTKPAILVITASAALMVSGALMLGFYPSTPLDALYQRRYVYTGATMLALGVAMAAPAITLGVLAGRQGKRDSALAEFNVRTDRPQADIALAPQFVPGGGAMGLRLRF